MALERRNSVVQMAALAAAVGIQDLAAQVTHLQPLQAKATTAATEILLLAPERVVVAAGPAQQVRMLLGKHPVTEGRAQRQPSLVLLSLTQVVAVLLGTAQAPEQVALVEVAPVLLAHLQTTELPILAAGAVAVVLMVAPAAPVSWACGM